MTVTDDVPLPGQASGPELLADGTDELDTVVVEPLDRPCPRCGASCRFDPVVVARDGQSVGWARSAETFRLQERLLACLPFAVGTFDGGRTLSSMGGVRPSVGRSRCASCLTELLVVVSHGEVQPARYWLVFDGLITANDA